MSEETEKPQILWKDKNSGKIIRSTTKGTLVRCTLCPCCVPQVLASTITNKAEGRERWDLSPYKGDNIGLPGMMWRLRDVGESHHLNPQASCSGTIYKSGRIDENGKLLGLPDEFVSRYYYNGYMEIQMGCVNDDGSVTWPCPNG